MAFKKRILLCSTLLLTPTAILASTGESKWSGEAELGLVTTSGNTETTTSNFKSKVENDRDKWRHTLTFETLHSSSENSHTAERYLLTEKTRYKINSISYAFGRFNHEDDRFSGYEYRSSAVIGYGRHLINEEKLKLDAEAGPGVRQSKPDQADSDSEGIFFVSGDLKWTISKTSKFTEELYSEIGDDATITKSVTGLKTQINGDLAMKVTYTAKHTSDVPVGVEKTDTETAVTLVYSF